MGCGESKHATATANTAITKRSSSSRTNSKKEKAPLDQQPAETAGNDDGTKNPSPQSSAPEKGDNIIHIVNESNGEGEKAALEAKEKGKNGDEGVEGGEKKAIDDKAKVEEKENGTQAKEGSLKQNEGDKTNEEYSCF